jgi:hypothetical protein
MNDIQHFTTAGNIAGELRKHNLNGNLTNEPNEMHPANLDAQTQGSLREIDPLKIRCTKTRNGLVELKQSWKCFAKRVYALDGAVRNRQNPLWP